MTLGVILVASACSVVGSPSAMTAELLGLGLGQAAERVTEGGRGAASLVTARLEGAILPTPTLTEGEPEVRTIRLKPRPKPGPFSMNLYSKGDFVHQQTPYWCVAASAQTMMNIMSKGKPNRSRAFQKRLFRLGHVLDDDDEEDDEPWWQKRGMGLTHWANVLDHHGYGPYVVDRAATRRAAIRKAARAIRMTGKPAGLVVWRGAHSWVMSGFEATADPAYTKDFEVRTVFIQDVWYPSVSSIWGASRPPDSAVPVRALAQDYLRYDRPRRRHPKRDGKFMLVLPTLPPDTRVR